MMTGNSPVSALLAPLKRLGIDGDSGDLLLLLVLLLLYKESGDEDFLLILLMIFLL